MFTCLGLLCLFEFGFDVADWFALVGSAYVRLSCLLQVGECVGVCGYFQVGFLLGVCWFCIGVCTGGWCLRWWLGTAGLDFAEGLV